MLYEHGGDVYKSLWMRVTGLGLVHHPQPGHFCSSLTQTDNNRANASLPLNNKPINLITDMSILK